MMQATYDIIRKMLAAEIQILEDDVKFQKVMIANYTERSNPNTIDGVASFTALNEYKLLLRKSKKRLQKLRQAVIEVKEDRMFFEMIKP